MRGVKNVFTFALSNDKNIFSLIKTYRMKKTFLSLAMMIASISLTATAASGSMSANNGTSANVQLVTDTDGLSLGKFEGIVVEQTVTFAGGKKAVVYYKIEDGCIAVYSETDLSHYSINDLLDVKTSSERKVTAVKGKRYGKYSLREARRIASKWLGL